VVQGAEAVLFREVIYLDDGVAHGFVFSFILGCIGKSVLEGIMELWLFGEREAPKTLKI